MRRTAVINIVGLTERCLSPHTPRLSSFRVTGSLSTVKPVLPGLTCTAQATYLTGLPPAQHGIVANGWFNRELSEVQFWKQSNHLVHGRKLWEDLRSEIPGFTCAKLFWWYNMYSSADFSITPRPLYPADGRKVFDIHTWPYSIRPEIKADLGEFPFPGFWGPAAGLNTPQGPPDVTSRWIANSAKWIEERYSPSLSLVYLPHLDYNLQRLGPDHPSIPNDLRAIDQIAGDLIDFYHQRNVQVALLSEYGITPVQHPIHLNRLFRQQGWLAIKDELGLELLDPGASKAFAVADHQLAHIYVQDPSLIPNVQRLLEKTPGIHSVFAPPQNPQHPLNHPRAGDLVAVSNENAWFTYYYWLDDSLAPDFARTVDIHRKPGYDPVELFLDPAKGFIKLRIALRLLQKKLGFRMLMDVIPLDASLVRGSHGACPANTADWPILMLDRPGIEPLSSLSATQVYHTLRRFTLAS